MMSAAVVGGGLAGLSVSLRLLQRGFDVTVFDASHRVGGKAGANHNAGTGDDHGYHIFPAWYLNTWRLVDELGIRGNFVDCTDFAQLDAGEFPKFRVLKNITDVRYFWTNLFSGVSSIPEMFLFNYFSLDLASQPYRYKAFLDRISLGGFLRSRFYRTERLALAQQDLILKGISVPSYDVSAMAVRNVMRYWLKYPTPMFRILRGDLQTFFIRPIEDKVRSLGGKIQYGHRLERLGIAGNRVRRLVFTAPASGATYEVAVDGVIVLAIPADKVLKVLNDDLFAVAPRMFNARYLRVRAMAALNVYLKTPIPGLPDAHVNLVDSKYGLSLIDVSQRWRGVTGAALNVIASDFTALEGVSAATAEATILNEMRRYLPGMDPRNIVKTVFQPHVDEPLFMNDVGAWEFRPDARSELGNLYFAGDYCRSSIDLLSMEGAVTTGLLAAETIRQDAGCGTSIPIAEPATHPRWLLLFAKYLLLPVAVLAKLWILLSPPKRLPTPTGVTAVPASTLSASRVRR